MKIEKVRIDEIVRDDPSFIVRTIRNNSGKPVDDGVVKDYVESIDNLPPIETWTEPETNRIILLDGQHRIDAHLLVGREEIDSFSFQGDRKEAIARANTANFSNGFQLSRSEKKEARVRVFSSLYEQSNNWIAKDYLHCSPAVVATLREELETSGAIPYLESFKRKGGGVVSRSKPEEENVVEENETETGSETELGVENPPIISDEDFMEGMMDEEGDSGYDLEADIAAEKANGGLGSGSGKRKATSESMSEGGIIEEPLTDEAMDDFSESNPSSGIQKTFKFGMAPKTSPLAGDVIFYVNNQPHNIPVTIYITDSEINGLAKIADDHENALVISLAKAREMGFKF